MADSVGADPRVSILVVCLRRVDLLHRCLQSLARNVSAEVSFETIVVFNGTHEHERDRIRGALEHAQTIVSGVNLGFGGANNLAAHRSRGEYLVFLNDDAEVQPGWLEELVATADAHPDVGAVGSRILHPDGTLQEAGSVIWRDGSTQGVGRGLPAGSGRYDYLREVDYVSACSLLVRRDTFERLGGFDERFFPAYYEDADLCLGIRRIRQRVLYQPRSVIMHHESQTGGEAKTFLMLRGRERLREKWGSELERFAVPTTDTDALELAVHRARRSPRRVLMIDDRLPDPGVGSGFGRMLDAIRELVSAGYAVSFHATNLPPVNRRELQELGLDVIDEDLLGHLRRPSTLYDVAIVSRPHNSRVIGPLRRHQSQCAIVYDAEALFHRRLEREAELLEQSDPEAAELAGRRAAAAQRQEQRIVRVVDRVVSVSEVEAEILRSIPGHCPIDVIEPLGPQTQMTPSPFADRRGMLFVAGWLAPHPSPNSDGLEWFVDQILPLIKARLPWARLDVTGARPNPEIRRLSSPSLRFLGHVEQLAAVYDRARVVVVPVRFGAGIKIKAIEALQHGVPVVSTSIGAEGISTGREAVIDVYDEPAAFAARVLELLEDRRAWELARAGIARLQNRWISRSGGSWAAIVETARTEKNLGRQALQR